MNSYHPYQDISSPHPPSPDNNNYASSMSIGNAAGHHHNGHAQLMSSIGGQQQGFHQINNNNAMMNKCAGCGSKYNLINLIRILNIICKQAKFPLFYSLPKLIRNPDLQPKVIT